MIIICKASDTGGREAGGPCPPPSLPTFLHKKNKIGKKRGTERISKQKLLKGCHQGQNVTVLAILERLEFKNFLTEIKQAKILKHNYDPTPLPTDLPTTQPHFESTSKTVIQKKGTARHCTSKLKSKNEGNITFIIGYYLRNR